MNLDDKKFQRAYNLKLIADEYNQLSDYEKYIDTHKDRLDNIYNACLAAAKKGSYSTGIFVTFRYNDPDKAYLVKYFKDLKYDVDLFEPGLINGENAEPTEYELQQTPYRQYMLMLKW